MTADQLRELSELIRDCALNQRVRNEAADYLRACADAMEAGPQPVSVADELPPDRIEAIAHRTATFYRHDEVRGHEYMFKRRELLDFAARLLAEAQPSSNPCQLQSFGNSEQLTIPQGWRLVPVEPTQEMVDAAFAATRDDPIDWMRKHYRAMLAAAQTPPVASLRLPEPMTDAEAKKLGNDLSYLPTMTDVVVYVEAEVLRRVKEANNE